MTRAENKTEKNNFEIGPDGKIIISGVELKPREGIKPAPKNIIEEKVDTSPVQKPKKRKRWYKGSFLLQDQDKTEDDNIEKRIA